MRHSILMKATAPLLRGAGCVANKVHRERNRNPIIISGSPRAGTTWVAESIAKALGSRRILWEPLQEGNPDRYGKGFSKRPFLTDGNVTQGQIDFFKDIISAKNANAHTLRLRKFPGNFFHSLNSDRLIIKFVRGNGVVGWMHRELNIPKPLIIIRHPCAVISSQLKMGTWKSHPHVDPGLVEYYPEFRRFLKSESDLHMRLALTWAGDFLAAYHNKESVHIVHYESLVTNGAKELLQPLRDWGVEEYFSNVEDALIIPSSTVYAWSDLSSTLKKMNRWTTELAPSVVFDIMNLIKDVGIDCYEESPVPLPCLSKT